MGKLTNSDVETIRLGIKEGRTYQELADQFGVSRNCIWGIKHNKTHRGFGPDVARKRVSRRVSERKRKAICVSLQMGEKHESIAKRFKVSINTVGKIKKESAFKDYGFDVSSITRQKLSEDDVRTIKSRLQQGETGAELAREYGVSKAHISDIKLGKCWSQVDSGSSKNLAEERQQFWNRQRARGSMPKL